MYYYVIRYVLLNKAEKTGIIDNIGASPWPHLFIYPTNMVVLK